MVHPNESQATEGVFPISVRPKRGEIFSSWAARVGLSHGVGLNALMNYLYTNWQYKKRDIDKFADKEITKKLASAVNADIDMAIATSLHECISRISGRYLYNQEWVTHVNNIYTKRRSYGLCFCPKCFEDKDNFFKLTWRLSFLTICEKHKCLLSDHCGLCGSEINLYRIKPKSRYITFCYCCGFDLSCNLAIQSPCFDSYFEKQEKLLALVRESQTASQERLKEIKVYFHSLYLFTYYIMHTYYAICPKNEVWRSGNYEKHAYFDCYSVLNRLLIVDLAISCYNDFTCNFKLHLKLASESTIDYNHKRIKSPCDSWCARHDYLNIHKNCEKLLETILRDRILRQDDKFRGLKGAGLRTRAHGRGPCL